MVRSVTIDINTIKIIENSITLTLSWREPYNNFDQMIVNYTVSCSQCPATFTTDSATRSYTITNLTTMTNYTFSVVATNSISSGKAGVVMITTPPGEIIGTVHKPIYFNVCNEIIFSQHRYINSDHYTYQHQSWLTIIHFVKIIYTCVPINTILP